MVAVRAAARAGPRCTRAARFRAAGFGDGQCRHELSVPAKDAEHVREFAAIVCSTALALGQGPPQQDPAPTAGRGPMLLPQAIVLPRGDKEIAIDGTLTDWPELLALRLDDPRQLSGTALKAWNGPRDASAFAFLMWDDAHLFFAAAVRDEWHRALDPGSLQLSEIPLADSIVLTFDPDRDTRSTGPDDGRREDREFWLADETGREIVQWDRLRGTARVLSEGDPRAVVLYDKEAGITTYEARIPWPEILPVGRQPRSGMVIDLEIVINDFDEPTDPIPQTRIGWTFGCGPVVDPGLLGSMMLVADAAALQGHVPEFPPKPPTAGPPLGTAEQWHDLTARLLRSPPALHDGTIAPEQAGGLDRLRVLEEIDRECARFPRVDFVEFVYRIQREMKREVAGIRARGLPYWWDTRLRDVSKAGEDKVPAGTARIFRLPMGGWLIATPTSGCVVDAAGADLPHWLWGRCAFSLTTQPLDATKRSDPLLVRMLATETKRPVLTHIAFQLPIIRMADMPLVEPGKAIGTIDDMAVRALGTKMADGSVPGSCGYRIDVVDGPRILVVAPSTTPAHIDEEPVDVLILSPRNPHVPEIIAKATPGVVLFDEAFLCQSLPDVPRVNLETFHTIQKALQPQPSVLLAPGESWDVARH
ncbi:MAG: hypothetical protein KDE27_25505 [Planctomycetes bacterium]|nr:hypothetical protein [Planctomycetota bacterium]